MRKQTTWLACGLVAAVPLAGGIGLDRVVGTGFAFAFAGGALAVLYLVATFAPATPLFGRVARARADAGRFALTFDDGPNPRFTPQISRLLADREHHATFFVLGAHARRYPELLRQLLSDGHELASHGFDHRLLAFTSPSGVREQLVATEDAIAAATGQKPAPLFRAPHGVRSPWLVRAVGRRGYRACAWTGTIFDTTNPGVARIVERAARHLRPGSILLLHDADGSGGGNDRSQTVAALPAILDEAERRGLRSVCLSSLLELPPERRRRPRRAPA